MIKDLGGNIASVWETLRPVTRKMLTGAIQSQSHTGSRQFFYDAQADWELTNLLSALDERSSAKEILEDRLKRDELEQLAEGCIRLLESRSASAEVFILLATRALRANDFKRLDKLADTLSERYSTGEIAEVIRQTYYPQIRAIAAETLAQMPSEVIAPLLDDPLYSDIAALALEQKAFEFESEDAKILLDQFDQSFGFSE